MYDLAIEALIVLIGLLFWKVVVRRIKERKSITGNDWAFHHSNVNWGCPQKEDGYTISNYLLAQAIARRQEAKA